MGFLVLDATISDAKRKTESGEEIIVTEIKAVYISYLEYLETFNSSITINKTNIDKMIDHLKSDGFNTIILHVSPFSDSIYPSSIMPYSYTLTGREGKNPGFDYLDYYIQKAHAKKINVYAWINPYRVSLSNDSSLISEENPAYKLLNTSSVMVDKKGIYYNPASEIVKNLIINQITEIIKNYDIDGIHFDDYFYIQDGIDQQEYLNFIHNGGNLSKEEFRFYHTNDLIKRVYTKIKDLNPQVTFSIAPDGNINNNYLYHSADVKTWLKNDGYVDIIMPQLYYGFLHEYLNYNDALNNWLTLRTNPNIKVVPVLAFYKSGEVDKEAGSGKNEWLNNTNLIQGQLNVIHDKALDGYALFRYNFLYSEQYQNTNSIKELENIKTLNK